MSEKLQKKCQDCHIFHISVCWFGILIPLLYLLGILVYPMLNKEDTIMATEEIIIVFVFVLITILIALLSTYYAYRQYDKGRERVGDWTLYICGILTIVLIALIVNYTGGIRQSLMSFYFFFIPSAIAIVFDSKKGLIATSVCCILSIFILFHLYSSSNIRYETIHYLVFSIYQLLLILGIEMYKNIKTLKNNPIDGKKVCTYRSCCTTSYF